MLITVNDSRVINVVRKYGLGICNEGTQCLIQFTIGNNFTIANTFHNQNKMQATFADLPNYENHIDSMRRLRHEPSTAYTQVICKTEAIQEKRN